MKVEVTYHAQDRLQERGFTVGQIKSVLKKPLLVEKQGNDTYKAACMVGDRKLCVIYRKKVATYLIITAYYENNLR